MTAPFRLIEFPPAGTAWAGHPKLGLRPTRDDGNEFTVLIGPNGTGKSALLGGLARAAESGKGLGALNPSRTIAIANLVTDAFPLGRAKGRWAYHYMGLRQGSNTVTTGALTAASLTALVTLPMSAVPGLDWEALSERLQMEPPKLIAIPTKRAEKGTSATANFEGRFADIDARLAREFEESKPFRNSPAAYGKDAAVVSFSEMSERLSAVLAELEEEIDAASLLRRLPNAVGWRLQLEYERKPSAGQEVLFSQLLRYATTARPQALVLVDEPDTALHPQWQSNVIPLMREMVPDHLGMHILLATHSPFLVGEADSVVSASERGFEQLDADFGAISIDEIIYRVFGATTSGSVLVEQDVSKLLHYVSDATVSSLPSSGVAAAAERLRTRKTADTDTLRLVLDEFDRIVSRRGRQPE